MNFIEDTTSTIIGTAIDIHREMGPGMLESTYETMLEHELRGKGMKIERQKYVDFIYKDLVIERAFCVDLIVNGAIVLEIKAIEKVIPVHMRQLLTYLRALKLPIGLLLNFGQSTLKEGGIHRMMNGTAIPPKY